MRCFVLALALTAAAAADQCGPGEYLNGELCIQCERGTYKSTVGAQTYCNKCQPGRFHNPDLVGGAATSSNVCVTCPAGWFHPTANDDERTTNDGASVISQACAECEGGTYQDKRNQRFCKMCPAGSFHNLPMSDKIQDCEECDLGTYKLKLPLVQGATALLDTCEFRPVDCVEDEWSPWTRCDKVCGGGEQFSYRSELTPADHNGKPCGEMSRKRRCNTKLCSETEDRYPTAAELTNGKWWEFTYVSDWGPKEAECRYQENTPTGPNRWMNVQDVKNYHQQDGHPLELVNYPVDGWCCRVTQHTNDGHEALGQVSCYSTARAVAETGFMDVLGTKMVYQAEDGSINNNDTSEKVATVKKILLHKQKCLHTTCTVEEHSCTAYKCPRTFKDYLGGFCPNLGAQRCVGDNKHYTMRVSHPEAGEEEVDDGHFCQVTSHEPTIQCECYCLDVYKHLSVADDKLTESDETSIPNSHFNYGGHRNFGDRTVQHHTITVPSP